MKNGQENVITEQMFNKGQINRLLANEKKSNIQCGER